MGVGVIGSGSAEGGIGIAGAGANGSAGAGVFGGGSKGLNAGAFGGYGGFAGGPNYGKGYPPPCPDTPNVALGAFAGAGAGPFITNATSPSDLKGPFTNYNLNVGVGPAKFSIQVGFGGGTWIGSVTVGPGVGVSGSSYPTNTTRTWP